MANAISIQGHSFMTTPSDAVEIYCVKCKAKTASKGCQLFKMWWVIVCHGC